VTLRGVYDFPMFSPSVLIRTVAGLAYQADYPYHRMEWDFEQLALQLRRCVDGIPGGQLKLDQTVATVAAMDEYDSPAALFALGLD
jgi:hypothetical protein